ncbi:hypothetical protein AX16_003856 [Volvariella volvacea WC 439]|nr:hypothetical protein AX16_003856 [Volvariella volvacea WC 439]
MSAASSARLLRLALPLVKDYGFTREALAHSVFKLPQPNHHTEPLTETAVSSLFGHGDDARRTLIHAWLDEGISQMKHVTPSRPGEKPSVRDALHGRLSYNEPVLQHLSEAFALLASPPSAIPPLDPMPSLRNAARIADEACYVGGDASLNASFPLLYLFLKNAYQVPPYPVIVVRMEMPYASLMCLIFVTAELHQLTSPQTAHDFLDSMLDTSTDLKKSFDEVALFSSYMFKSWKGILKSRGMI